MPTVSTRSPSAAVIGALSLLLALPLQAAPPAPEPEQPSGSSSSVAPDFDALLARLDTQPAAVEAAALRDAADARADQARALPNPTLAFDIESVYGTGPYNGSGAGESLASVSQPLELFGQRRARIGAARAEAVATGLTSEQMRWDAAARLTEAFADAEASLRRQSLADEALTLAEADGRAIDALVDAGREAALRGVQARAEIEAARAEADDARARRDGALARLAAVAMLDRAPDGLADSLLDRVPAHDDSHGGEALAVRIASAEVDAADRLIDVERRRAMPDLALTVGQQRFRESGDRTYTAGISLTVPLFDRNRGGIRAAHADRRAAEARLMGQQQSSRADRLAAEAALAASRSRTRAADSAVTAAEEAYRLARIGTDAGRISQLELRSSRTALVAARNRSVDARLARVAAEIDLARVEGRAPFGETP